MADQVVENLQRNALTPREIADFIGRELAQGFKRSEIAKIISKSPAFITQHANLLDLPDPIADAFNAGRAKDVTVVSELLTAFKRNASEVEDWLAADNREITRSSVKLLRAFLDDKRQHVVVEWRRLISANAHIAWAAAKSISLSTAGGANITIEGGNITIQCRGKILVHAGAKKFSGPERLSMPMPELPRSICVECLRKSLAAAPAFTVVG